MLLVPTCENGGGKLETWTFLDRIFIGVGTITCSNTGVESAYSTKSIAHNAFAASTDLN